MLPLLVTIILVNFIFSFQQNLFLFLALAHTVRDHLVSRWIRTQQHYYEKDPKVFAFTFY